MYVKCLSAYDEFIKGLSHRQVQSVYYLGSGNIQADVSSRLRDVMLLLLLKFGVETPSCRPFRTANHHL